MKMTTRLDTPYQGLPVNQLKQQHYEHHCLESDELSAGKTSTSSPTPASCMCATVLKSVISNEQQTKDQIK